MENEVVLSKKGWHFLIFNFSILLIPIIAAGFAIQNPVINGNPTHWSQNILTFFSWFFMFQSLGVFLAISDIPEYEDEKIFNKKKDKPRIYGLNALSGILAGLLIIGGAFWTLFWFGVSLLVRKTYHDEIKKEKKKRMKKMLED